MSTSDESDEQDVSSHAIHGLLTDRNLNSNMNLNMPSHSDQLSPAQLPSWSFPSTASSRNSPAPSPSPGIAEPSTSATIFPPRTVSRHSSNPQLELDPTTSIPSIQQPSLFNTPNRSIFSSGPPTSSLSANTAQASMSAPSPVNSAGPLSALTVPSSSSSARRSNYYQHEGALARRTRIARAEKDVDDPSVNVERARSVERRGTSTPTALTRLFAAPEASTPTISRHTSYIRTQSGTAYTRALSSETAPLPSHLYNRGLLNGRHSDIAVHAFGTRYALHRLLLDRAPFFSSALSEPWFESSSKEIDLHPDDIDSNITQAAFELALKRLYGCNITTEEDKEAVGLFATGCWLEMADLIDSSVTSILRQMSPIKLAPLIRLVTTNYYGKPGDRILASAKAMLCREGWEMPLRYWDGISGEIAREIIGGDGFFIHSEWERWVLAKRILDRRLKLRAIEAGLLDSNGRHKHALPETMNFLAIRFDTVYRKNSSFGGRSAPPAYDPWLGLYTSPDIAALLVLLDEGIHYVHLSFEQLQNIRNQRDVLGLPVMPEKVISNALWMSMELRQKILNANESDMELGLSQVSEDLSGEDISNTADVGKASNAGNDVPPSGKGKQVDLDTDENEDEEMESGSWDGNGKPRKFWIPNTDSTSVMGGNPDSVITTTNGHRSYTTRHFSRLSASIDPQDVQWASDFTASVHDRPLTPGRSVPPEPTSPISFTHYPPFRFAAEFPNPRNLKEKKRVYSRTVWYAGSLWNVYIQKVETTKNTQLGVYLHRAKEKEEHSSSVDERIGQVEMLMRRNERTQHRMRMEPRTEAEDDTGASSGDPDITLVADPNNGPSRATAISSLLRGDGIMKASQTPGTFTFADLPNRTYNTSAIGSEDDNEDISDASKKPKAATLPPYIDGRPSIKTYFKIYSPSRGGRMLSVYESAPDKFNFSQSWGWKSSTMILDDGLLGYEEGARSKDNRLRFMVVIGNV